LADDHAGQAEQGVEIFIRVNFFLLFIVLSRAAHFLYGAVEGNSARKTPFNCAQDC
jgi:hypothetical protein